MKLNKIQSLAAATLLLAGISTAQTQLVRGDIADVPGTNRFLLECTDIELTSVTVSLQTLHDQSQQSNIDYAMQVTLISSGLSTVLNVVSAAPIPEMMDMGNMNLGATASWEVNGTPGSMAWVFISARVFTRYTPAGPLGTWLLGDPIAFLAQGQIAANGQFQFSFTTPNNPLFLGVEITSQAVVQLTTGGFLVTNADCKVIEI